MSNQAVQHMLIRSKCNGYLADKCPYDGARNEVYLRPDLPEGSDSAKWILIPKEENNAEHQIVNVKSKEPLYAVGFHETYDRNHRRVFTRRPGDHYNEDGRHWLLQQCNNGYYTIKNKCHDEYLYASDYPSLGSVFTFRRMDDQFELNDKFYWKLMNA